MNPIEEDLETVLREDLSGIQNIRAIQPTEALIDKVGKNGTIRYTLKNTGFYVEFIDTFPPNNISFTWDERRGMFKLGLTLRRIDPRLERPPISGTYALQYLEKVARKLGVPEIFIADSSYVKCIADEGKQIEQFLLLRILTGKEGFYKRPSTNYLNRDLALETITLLRDTFMTPERREILGAYSTSTDSALCDRVNEVLNEAKDFLLQKERENSKPYLDSIKLYIMRPSSVGGRRRGKKTRKSKRKTRRVSK